MNEASDPRAWVKNAEEESARAIPENRQMKKMQEKQFKS